MKILNQDQERNVDYLIIRQYQERRKTQYQKTIIDTENTL